MRVASTVSLSEPLKRLRSDFQFAIGNLQSGKAPRGDNLLSVCKSRITNCKLPISR
jgi:hypothetical protein